MSGKIGCRQICGDGLYTSARECEDQSLLEENERLRQQVQDHAEAHAHVKELIARLDEADAVLRTEIERRRRLEEQLQRMLSRGGVGTDDRTAELVATNERLVRELTERARNEAALRERDHRLHGVLNSIVTGVLIIDCESRQIVDVNTHAAAAIGLPKEQIVGRVCHQFICPAQKGSCPITDLGQTVDRSERVLLGHGGAHIPILKSVVPVTWQGHEYLIESFIDIGRLTRVEDEARESLSLLEAALESMADGLLVVDGFGKIKEYNRQFQELWGLSDSVLDTRDDNLALASATPRLRDPEAFLRNVHGLYEQREEEGHDLIEFQDGRIVEYYSKPQRIGEQVVGRVWSFRDITEKHTAETKQTALLQRVAQINEELTHFAYVVSHDLKAPLRGIKLITEWLCVDYADKLGDDAKEQLDLLQSRVARMYNLIEGILQYSRVGRIKEETVDVDLNALLPSIIDGIALPEHVHVAVEPGLPVVECERTRITQVFQNLLTNAVKFMDKPVGEIRVGCVEDGELWQFHIADNGPGIEEKYFDRIFKLFQTLRPRDEFESTGVGLALVKKIVEMYGGRIWVESEVGRGSTFFFTFPRKRGTDASGSAAGEAVRSCGCAAEGT
ncbi:MAG: ATP-binding protein [Phycisphaerales bacterium]